MQNRRDARLCAGRSRAAEALPGLQKLETRRAIKPVRLRGQVLGDLVLRLGNQFGGGRGRGSAQVGDKIGNGEIGLMSDGRNHRQADAAIARATRSLLNAAKSSSDPPPRATTITSTNP